VLTKNHQSIQYFNDYLNGPYVPKMSPRFYSNFAYMFGVPMAEKILNTMQVLQTWSKEEMHVINNRMNDITDNFNKDKPFFCYTEKETEIGLRQKEATSLLRYKMISKSEVIENRESIEALLDHIRNISYLMKRFELYMVEFNAYVNYLEMHIKTFQGLDHLSNDTEISQYRRRLDDRMAKEIPDERDYMKNEWTNWAARIPSLQVDDFKKCHHKEKFERLKDYTDLWYKGNNIWMLFWKYFAGYWRIKDMDINVDALQVFLESSESK